MSVIAVIHPRSALVGAQSAVVIAVIYKIAEVIKENSRQTPSVAPFHALAAAVNGRIADCVIGDGMTVVGSQQVFPLRVAVGVGIGALRIVIPRPPYAVVGGSRCDVSSYIKDNTDIFNFELSPQEMNAIYALNIDYKFHPESLNCPGY